MSIVEEWLSRCLEWLNNPANRDQILVGLVIAILLATGAWLWKRGLPWLANRARRSFDNVGDLPAGLVRYHERVRTRALQIKHPWMKADQSLKDILVPVSIERREGAIEDLRTVVRNTLAGTDGVSRIVITGKPGAGKSVALWTVSEECWLVAPKGELSRIPIPVSFKEFRIAEYKLDGAIENALLQWGYDDSRGSRPCSEFVNEMLESGRFLVLLDALDELGQEHRSDAATRMVQQLSSERYRRTPAVISCRTAAWDSLTANFRSLPGLEEIHLADFTTAAIRRFVHSWRFQPPKSAGELLAIVGKQPHVAELAKNPLLLTIVCFLYSQPKYRLPENRAQFYEVCTRALLEEWDQASGRDKGNRFDRPDKEGCLGALAFEHVSGQAPETDIDRDTALSSFQSSMHARSLLPEHRMQLLNEIIERSGLLGELPPNGLRFPHKTFMEYFAARYALAKPPTPTLLERFRADSERWREVLLLACGLSDSEERTAAILMELLAAGDLETALAIMVDARALANDAGEKVMTAARAAAPTPTILACLGFIGANTLTTHASAARGILLNQLSNLRDGGFPKALASDLLVASLRCPDERILRMVEDHSREFELERVLPSLGDRLIPVATRIVADPTIPVERRRSWVSAMQRSGAVQALFSLAYTRDIEDPVRTAVELALAETSNLPEWWQELDNLPEEAVLAANLPGWNETQWIAARWGWPFSIPTTPQAKGFLAYLCERITSMLIEATDAPTHLAAMHPWIRVLCMGLLGGRSASWRYRLAYAPDDELWPGHRNNGHQPRPLRLTWTLARCARGRAWAKTSEWWGVGALLFPLLIGVLTVGWTIWQLVFRTPNTLPWAIAFLTLGVAAMPFGAWSNKEDRLFTMALSPLVLPFALLGYPMMAPFKGRHSSVPWFVLWVCCFVVNGAVFVTSPFPSWLAIGWLLAPVAMVPLFLGSFFPVGRFFPSEKAPALIRALIEAHPNPPLNTPAAPEDSAQIRGR